jgi:ribosomal protein L7/L12
MEQTDLAGILPLLGIVALGAFWLGRASAGAGGGASDDLMQRQMETEQLFSSMSPAAQADIDALVAAGKYLEAIKRVRTETGAGLKQSKDLVDHRKKQIGA